MNETHRSTAEFDSSDGNNASGLVEMLIVLAKRKKTIIGWVVAAACLSAGVTMILPESYKATVKLLPPQQAQSSASMLLSQLGGLGAAAAGAAGLKNPADVYVGMLKRRKIGVRFYERFDLHYLF